MALFILQTTKVQTILDPNYFHCMDHKTVIFHNVFYSTEEWKSCRFEMKWEFAQNVHFWACCPLNFWQRTTLPIILQQSEKSLLPWKCESCQKSSAVSAYSQQALQKSLAEFKDMAKMVHLGCYIEFSHTHKTNFFVKELFHFVAVLVCSLIFF